MADIVLINPKFEVSYWGIEYALPVMGKKANVPVACLLLLAALTPEAAGISRSGRSRDYSSPTCFTWPCTSIVSTT